MKKILYCLFFILLFFSLNIFIGIELKQNLIFIYLIPYIFLMFLIIYKLIKKKDIIIFTNLIDYIILIFLFLPIINIIFGNYVSLNSQVLLIFENFSLFCFYIILKNYKLININCIVKLVIFLSIIVVIISIDKYSISWIWNYLSDFSYFSGNVIANRLTGNFNYPNTLAIYLLVIMFLCYSQFIKTKKNIFYLSYSNLLMLLILFTESRITMFIMFLTIIFIIIFDKNNRIYFVLNIFLSLIIIFLYFIVSKCFVISNVLELYLIILYFVIMIILNIFVIKIAKKLGSIKFYKIFSIFLIFIFSIIIVIYALFQKSSDLYIDKSHTYVFNANYKNLDLVFDIETDFIGEYNNFQIIIIGLDKHNKEILLKEDIFTEYNGLKKYNITLDQNIMSVKIVFNNYYKNKFSVKKIYVNNKEYILNYKYLPNSFAYKFKNFSLLDKSLLERYYIYNDSLKIIKDYPFIGCGEDCWFYKYKSYSSYYYNINVMHSSILNLLITNGVLGLLLLLFISFLFINNIIKNFKQINLYLLISFLVLIIHSIIDFDFSFLIIKFLSVFMIVCLYSFSEKSIVNKKISYLFLVSLIASSIYLSYYMYYDRKFVNGKYIYYEQIVNIDKDILFNKDIKINKLLLFSTYIRGRYNYNQVNKDKLKEQLIYIFNNEYNLYYYNMYSLYIDTIIDDLNNNVVDYKFINNFNMWLQNNKFKINYDLSLLNIYLQNNIRLYNAYLEFYNKNVNSHMGDNIKILKEYILSEKYRVNYLFDNSEYKDDITNELLLKFNLLCESIN